MSDSPIFSIRSRLSPKPPKKDVHFPSSQINLEGEYNSDFDNPVWQRAEQFGETVVQELCLLRPCGSEPVNIVDFPSPQSKKKVSSNKMDTKTISITVSKPQKSTFGSKLNRGTTSDNPTKESTGILGRSRFGLFFKSDSKKSPQLKKSSFLSRSRSRSRSKVKSSSGRKIGKRLQSDSRSSSGLLSTKRDVGIDRQDTLMLHDCLSGVKRTTSEPSRSSSERERIFSYHNIVNNNHDEMQHDWEYKLANWATSLEQAISVIQREQNLREHISHMINENKSLQHKFNALTLECNKWKYKYNQANRELKRRDAVTTRCVKCDSMHALETLSEPQALMEINGNIEPSVMLRSWSDGLRPSYVPRPLHTSASMGSPISPIRYNLLNNGQNPHPGHIRLTQDEILDSIRSLEQQLGHINSRLVPGNNRHMDKDSNNGTCCNVPCL